MLLEICVSLVFVGVICDNSKLYIRPFSFCLVLHTIKMKIQVPLGPFIIHKNTNTERNDVTWKKSK